MKTKNTQIEQTAFPMTVSRLNPDGTETKLGIANSPEELDKFFPKLPPPDDAPLAHAIKLLKGCTRAHSAAREALDKLPQPQADKEIELVEGMIEDLQKASKILLNLQTLLLLQRNNQPLTRNQTIALGVMMRHI